MGKKRSAHRSSARGSSTGTSTSNAGSSSVGSSSGSVPSHLMGQTFSHPTGVPLRQGSFASTGGGGAASGGAGAGGSGGGLDSLSRQLASLSPAMLRELLAASGGLDEMGYNDMGGYDDDLPPDMGSAPYAAGGAGISGGVMSGSLGGSISGGSIDLGGNMGNLSPEDAAQAQRYLQSIGQALTAQLSASGNNPPNSSNGKVFGPPPPPPTSAPAGSATFSTGSMTLDLNSATGQGLTSQLEALSQLMMAQKDHANSILRDGHAAVDRSNVSEARKAEALEALDKLGESTRDHVANLQSLMGYMAAQGGGVAMGSGQLPPYTNTNSSSGSAGNSASAPPSRSASHNNGTASGTFGPADVDPSALPLFHELVRLTHSIAAAQESGDATAADDATNRLCEAVMRDPASMGALGAAMSNPTGMAGMTALFQGMAVGAGASGGPLRGEVATGTGKLGANGRGVPKTVVARRGWSFHEEGEDDGDCSTQDGEVDTKYCGFAPCTDPEDGPVDEDGWQYFPDFMPPSLANPNRKRGMLDFVRRRKLRRAAVFRPDHFLSRAVYGRCDYCDSNIVDMLSECMLDALALATLFAHGAKAQLADAQAIPLKSKLVDSLSVGRNCSDEDLDPWVAIDKIKDRLCDFADTCVGKPGALMHLINPDVDQNVMPAMPGRRKAVSEYLGEQERLYLAGLLIKDVDRFAYEMHCSKDSCSCRNRASVADEDDEQESECEVEECVADPPILLPQHR